MGTFIVRSVKSPNFNETRISGSFAPAGTGAVTAVKGRGFTVARSGAGVFTITLDRIYQDLISANACVQLATAADMAAQIGSYSKANRTLVIRTVVAATETDIAADANNRVHFDLVLVTSSI